MESSQGSTESRPTGMEARHGARVRLRGGRFWGMSCHAVTASSQTAGRSRKLKREGFIMMTRREAIQKTIFATAALSAGAMAAQTQPGMMPPPAAAAPTGPFKLPPLPYAYDALEPHIDAQTIQIHHHKPHAA